MKIKDKLLQLKKEMTRPVTTTLYHYNLEFKTVDGKNHIFTRMCYGDPSTLVHEDLLRYYLISCEYLEDDEGIKYPITNIISITPIKTDTIYNVKVKYVCSDFEKTWYQDNEIEIYKDEDK